MMTNDDVFQMTADQLADEVIALIDAGEMHGMSIEQACELMAQGEYMSRDAIQNAIEIVSGY